jgi:hypothetical protein
MMEQEIYVSQNQSQEQVMGRLFVFCRRGIFLWGAIIERTSAWYMGYWVRA